MRIVMTSLAVLALVACKPAGTANDMNAVDENVAMEPNAMEANATQANAMATPAAFQLNETTWEYTRKGQADTESIDASGNYVVWSGDKHVDHGTAVMKDDKACFTSKMDKEGEVCWTTQPTEIGETLNTVSDKGEKLAVKRVAFMPVPDAVKP
jgi:hypothetical protein